MHFYFSEFSLHHNHFFLLIFLIYYMVFNQNSLNFITSSYLIDTILIIIIQSLMFSFYSFCILSLYFQLYCFQDQGLIFFLVNVTHLLQPFIYLLIIIVTLIFVILQHNELTLMSFNFLAIFLLNLFCFLFKYLLIILSLNVFSILKSLIYCHLMMPMMLMFHVILAPVNSACIIVIFGIIDQVIFNKMYIFCIYCYLCFNNYIYELQ